MSVEADRIAQHFGRIVDLVRRTDGDELAAAASISDTVLQVGDTADFDENGGTLEINGDRYAYTTVDHDAATITLADEVLVAAEEGDRVDVVDEDLDEVVVEYVAHVLLDDQDRDDEPVEVSVQHSLVNYLAENVRGGVTESVTLIRDGEDDLAIFEVNGKVVTDLALEETRTEFSAVMAALQEDLTELNDVTLPALQADLATLDGMFPITATNISDGAVTTPKLAANSVTADKIIAGAVSADKLAANSVSADKIVANAVSTDKLAANAIDGMTVTGATIRTDSGGTRIELRQSGNALVAYYGGSQVGVITPNSTGGWDITGTVSKFWGEVECGTLDVVSNGEVRGALEVGGNLDVINVVTIDSLKDGGANNSATGPKYVRAGAQGVLYASTTAPSSRDLKDQIRDLAVDADAVLQLQPRQYVYKESPDQVRTGFIAEEAHDLGLGLWVGYEDRANPEKPTGFDYEGFTAALLAVCQRQQAQIDALIERLDRLEAEAS